MSESEGEGKKGRRGRDRRSVLRAGPAQCPLFRGASVWEGSISHETVASRILMCQRACEHACMRRSCERSVGEGEGEAGISIPSAYLNFFRPCENITRWRVLLKNNNNVLG